MHRYSPLIPKWICSPYSLAPHARCSLLTHSPPPPPPPPPMLWSPWPPRSLSAAIAVTPLTSLIKTLRRNSTERRKKKSGKSSWNVFHVVVGGGDILHGIAPLPFTLHSSSAVSFEAIIAVFSSWTCPLLLRFHVAVVVDRLSITLVSESDRDRLTD